MIPHHYYYYIFLATHNHLFKLLDKKISHQLLKVFLTFEGIQNMRSI